ncbi:hypothetical protein KEH51_19480 [[Brevibacterium] frigoritolerans]|uniref:Uncharacterized protein n=1 Tax=Peribacillus frigoritolerans TaxID=450367 RepID=A0A941J353_9BACI|nr:hypothetical protein [Peribacillus frigoritolerans]
MSMLSIHDSIQRDQLEMITLDQLGTLKKTHEAQLLPENFSLIPLRLVVELPLKEYFAIVNEILAVGCTIPLLAPISETSPFLGKQLAVKVSFLSVPKWT